jgi:hypothetical protein
VLLNGTLDEVFRYVCRFVTVCSIGTLWVIVCIFGTLWVLYGRYVCSFVAWGTGGLRWLYFGVHFGICGVGWVMRLKGLCGCFRFVCVGFLGYLMFLSSWF